MPLDEGDVLTRLARLEAQSERTSEKVTEIRSDLRDMREEVGDIRVMLTKWNGGIAAIIAVGAVLGWLLSQIGPILKALGVKS